MEEIERVNENPEFREYMSAEEDNRKIENSIRSEGYEDGVKYGIEQGKKEVIEEIVKEMIKKNYSIEEILQLTGLDEQELKSYK